MSAKLLDEIHDYQKEESNLKAKHIHLIEKRKKLVLQRKDTINIDSQIKSVDTKISDIQNILLPHLEEKLKKVREAEAEALRQKTIKEILAEDAELTKKAKSAMLKLVECHDIIKDIIPKIVDIKIRHGQIMSELVRLGGQHPEGFRWEPIVIPDEFTNLANLSRDSKWWLRQWKGR